MARIEIDESICLGSGMCELMAEHLFAVNSHGVAVPLEPDLHSTESVNAATDAMNGCPSGAIRITGG